MPLRKDVKGYFTAYGLSRLNHKISGCFLLRNSQGEIIYLSGAPDIAQAIKELFNSNHYVWRYKPNTFEIEDSDGKDYKFRLEQLRKEIKPLYESDFEFFD